MTKEQAEFLASVCEEYGIEYDIRDSYSGRGMYGKTTHAIVVPGLSTLLCSTVDYMRGLSQEELNQIPPMYDFNQDNMGRDSVILY